MRLEVVISRSNPLSQSGDGCFKMICPQRTFPDYRHAPAGCMELFSCTNVARDVSSKLLGPESPVGIWCRAPVAAAVTMPEAAMDKDRNPVS
jgi:hypothetical protein